MLSRWWTNYKARKAQRKQERDEEYNKQYINKAVEALMDLEPAEAFEAIQQYSKRLAEGAKKVLAYQKQIKNFTGEVDDGQI